MKAIIFLAALAVVTLSRPDGPPGKHRGPLTDEQKAKFEAEFKEKVDKLSPEAQTAAKKIHDMKAADHDRRDANRKKIDEIMSGLSEALRKEVESVGLNRRGPHGGPKSGPHGGPKGAHGPHGPSPLTEEQKAKAEAEMQEKISKLSPEAQEVAKKIKAIRDEDRTQFQASRKSIDDAFAGLSEPVRKEVETVMPRRNRGRGPKGGPKSEESDESD